VALRFAKSLRIHILYYRVFLRVMFALCSAAEVADCQSNQHQTDE